MITGLSDGKIILHNPPKHRCSLPIKSGFGNGSVWQCLHCGQYWIHKDNWLSYGWFIMSNRKIQKFFKQHPELQNTRIPGDS